MKEGALHELPGGWVWTNVGEIIHIIDYRGRTPPYSPTGVPHLRSSNIKEGKIVWKGLKYVSEETYQKYMTRGLSKKGDVLFSTEAPLGEVALAPEQKFSIAQRMMILRPHENLLISKFLLYQIMSERFQGHLKGKGTGTTVTGVSSRNFRPLKLIIPPLPEQRAIVSKIEQLFSDLDNGIENFKKAQAQLKLYRQSVLKAACEGTLVPTEAELARAQGRDYEAADVLLARILKERREKWNGKGKYEEAEGPDTSGLPELPKGWMWTQVGEITEKIEKVSPENEPEAEFIYLDISSIDNRHLKIIEPKKYLGKDAPSRAKQKVKTGDVLFSTVRTYLKNIAQVPSIYDGQIASTGFSILHPSTGVNENFLFYYVQTEKFLNPLTDIQRGTSYPAVRDGDVREQFFPLLPLAEQHRIVAEVERRLSVSDKMEATISESLQKAESLSQSILKKAFEGKLLNKNELEKARNSPDWEPAEKLLERIRQEKERTGKKRKR